MTHVQYSSPIPGFPRDELKWKKKKKSVCMTDHMANQNHQNLETNDMQCVWLEITPDRGKSFLIGNMYRPPNSKVEFNDKFENFIDYVMREEKEIILMGDFNKDLFNEEIGTEWINFTTSLGLGQLISIPTRVTETSSTLIDHIYTNREENILRVHVGKFSLSDHYAIFGNRKLNSQLRNKKHHTITYRSFRHFNENMFIKDLAEVPWETIAAFDKVDDMVQTWNDLFLEIVNKHAPIKTNRVKRKHQPEWLTSEILDLMKERDKCKINGKIDEYRILRNKISKMIVKQRKKCIEINLKRDKMTLELFGKYLNSLVPAKKWNLQKMLSALKLMNRLSRTSK